MPAALIIMLGGAVVIDLLPDAGEGGPEGIARVVAVTTVLSALARTWPRCRKRRPAAVNDPGGATDR
jgi:hypothetical protein